MAGICTSSTRDKGGDCGHLTTTVDLDGVPYSVPTGFHDPRWFDALTVDETRQMLQLLYRWRKSKGDTLATIAAFVGRVLAGEEATNVKIYPLLAKDITKTNIGTAYVNLPIGANGERRVIDFTGVTEIRLRMWANLVLTGPFQFRVVRDSDDAVILESASIALTGERELDSDWVAKPALSPVLTGLVTVRIQGKSTTGTDDPVIRGVDFGVR